MMFEHLLPRARVWFITPVQKFLRKFFNALENAANGVRENLDRIYNDTRPQHTRELDKWNDQFALPDTNLTLQAERDRLAAAMRRQGGQTRAYIESVLQQAGFPLYVHNWWESLGPPVVPRDPVDWLGIGTPQYTVLCGEPDALCGESDALCGESESEEKPGYPLVNLIYAGPLNYTVLCGEPVALCGESDALCGEFEHGEPRYIHYDVPTNPDTFRHFIYIGGAVFGDVVNITPARRYELETLVLKMRPLNKWVGMFVKYV